jgi:hypothetical protein
MPIILTYNLLLHTYVPYMYLYSSIFLKKFFLLGYNYMYMGSIASRVREIKKRIFSPPLTGDVNETRIQEVLKNYP